jgi:ribosomal-protein-serine acetyltransferase
MFTLTVDEKIELKLLEQRDAEELIQEIHNSREYLREWLPWVDGMQAAEDYHPIIKMWLEQFANNDGFQAGIVYENKIVGMAGFHGIDWKNKKTSIGYWLSADYQGKGIMTKVTKTLVDHAIDELDLNRVEIRCGVENKKSRAIPERLGFRQEGIISEGEFLYDHFIDHAIYGLLAKDWNK